MKAVKLGSKLLAVVVSNIIHARRTRFFPVIAMMRFILVVTLSTSNQFGV